MAPRINRRNVVTRDAHSQPSDAMRSLLVSQYLLGTKEVMIINHTDCGLMKATEQEPHQRIQHEAGLRRVSRSRFTPLAMLPQMSESKCGSCSLTVGFVATWSVIRLRRSRWLSLFQMKGRVQQAEAVGASKAKKMPGKSLFRGLRRWRFYLELLVSLPQHSGR